MRGAMRGAEAGVPGSFHSRVALRLDPEMPSIGFWPAAVIAGWPWNRCRVVRMESDGGRQQACDWSARAGASGMLRSCRRDRAQGRRVCRRLPGSLGGIGFCGLEGDIVHLAGGCAVAFAGAMAFTDDGCPVRMHGDPDPGDVDGQECAPVLAGKDAFGFDGLPAPAVKAEDPVGFRDGVPALEIGQLPAMGLAGPDMATIGLTPQRL